MSKPMIGEDIHLHFNEIATLKLAKLKILSGHEETTDVIKSALALYEKCLEHENAVYVEIYGKYVKLTIPKNRIPNRIITLHE